MATYKLSEDFIKNAMEQSIKDIFKRDLKKKIIDDLTKEIDSILDQALSDLVGRVNTYEDFANQNRVFVINIDGVEKIKESLSK